MVEPQKAIQGPISGLLRRIPETWADFDMDSLTDQRVSARSDLDQGNLAVVFDFVMKRSTMAFRPPVQGHGRLERTAKTDANFKPASVNIENWDAAGKAIAEALANLFTVRQAESEAGKQIPELTAPAADDDDAAAGEEGAELQAAGPMPDEHDERVAWWVGKRIYLGRDTQVSRLFWLLAKPVGRAHSLGAVQRAVDGMETNAGTGSTPKEIEKARKRVRKAISKLRAALREAKLDDHYVIHRGGTQDEPEYSLIPRFGPNK